MNHRLEFVLRYGVFDLLILNLPIDLSLIQNSVVLESKGNSIGYSGRIVFINNLQQKFFIVKRTARTLGELSESDEIVRVDSVESLQLGSKGAHIKDEGSDLDLASETRLIVIEGKKSDQGVLVSPETAQSALHVSSGQLYLDGALAVLAETEDVPNTLTMSDLVESLELAFQEESH
jgi:hypothetical protein